MVRELGRGGMATVYLARDLTLERMVAVKVLHRELASHIGSGRFTREIRITAQLQHRGILPLLDSGEMDGMPFYTMPYVEGDTLAHRLAREQQLPIDVAIRYTTEIADALAYAHASGVLHRDIKPSNVLLVEDHAVLADFGIARAMDASAHESLTDSGLAVGTAHYMSPEQASADKLDERSDLYALACLLYEMLAGSPPFTGATTQAILARHMVDAVPSLRTVRQSVTPATDRVVQRALAKVPADRFASVAEFRDALVAAQLDTSDAMSRAARRPALISAAVVIIAAILIGSWFVFRTPTLDTNRIVGFPLRAPAAVGGSASAGEDVATLIGSALDRRGALRWIDGWQLLTASERTGVVDQRTARRIAMAQHAAWFLTGDIVSHNDSADVILKLWDVKGDSTIASGRASGVISDFRQASRLSVNQLLPSLVPAGSTRDLAPAWADRDPGAVASFLRGEAAYRRAQYGSALQFFRDAVLLDSNFALAAVRGAQAATADHRPDEAATLVRSALGKPMAPQYAAFTRGYAAYLGGFADSAVRQFREALRLDPEMTSAWAQLGETYIHLVPTAVNADSLAELAFDSARSLDPGSVHLLLHPIEIRLRRRDASGAAPMVDRFLAAKPDSQLSTELVAAVDCIRKGPDNVDWKAAVRRNALGVASVGAVLAGHGGARDFATAAYAAVLDHDTASTVTAGNERASALVGLVGVLVAQNRPAEARARIEKSIARGDGGASLYMFAAPWTSALDSAASSVAQRDSTRFAPDYTRCSTTERCWLLASYEASRGRAGNASAIANVLQQRTTADSNLYARNLVKAVLAHAQLARGDSTGARAAFASLLASPVSAGTALVWLPGGALGAERLQYARLLLAANQPAEARAVASAFDASSPTSFALYLRASLELRAQASDRLADARGAQAYRARLLSLASSRGQ